MVSKISKKSLRIIGVLIIAILAVSVFWMAGKRTEVDINSNILPADLSATNAQTPAAPAAEPVEKAAVLLGRPADTSIALNVVPAVDGVLTVAYGSSASSYEQVYGDVTVKAGHPTTVELSGLRPDSRYYYKAEVTGASVTTARNGTFHTARSSGADFTFAVEADPHMDEQSDPAVFQQSLAHVLADGADFLVDLGDTFMTDKLPQKDAASILERYTLMRGYFDGIGHSVPLLLVLGNHDGEAGWDFSAGGGLAEQSRQDRLLYYANPRPGKFYSSNDQREVGQFVKDYYAFTWGDALFVMLDPYLFTVQKPKNDGWDWTLGRTQYDWLKETLETSRAKYKFVFIHQLVGGDSQGRGGVEVVKLYEWGGNNADGSYGFDSRRPGWGKPIHQLLVDNHVSAVFKGHDHTYVKQELDGVIYQTLPQPSHPGEKNGVAGDYGYSQGETVGGSGYLRVNVSAQQTTVQFVRADDAGTVAASYEIK